MTPWVAGWGTELLLLLMSAMALWFGAGVQSSVYLTGSLIIGVLRQIERGRRTKPRESPDPGGRVESQGPFRVGP